LAFWFRADANKTPETGKRFKKKLQYLKGLQAAGNTANYARERY
jgi:hypothetical protein